MSGNTNLLLLQLKLQKKEDDYFLVTLVVGTHRMRPLVAFADKIEFVCISQFE